MNNKPFNFNCEERKESKRIFYMSEKKEIKYNIKERKKREERENENALHQMLVVCFNAIEGWKRVRKNENKY